MSASTENGTPTLREFHDPEGHGRPYDDHEAPDAAPGDLVSPDLRRYLAEIKGQAQFLLYLADQIEESLDQLVQEGDPCHGAFLCKVLGMYSAQLETKHQGLGEKIAETCQEVYVTVREREHG
ncbi:hypothetical protein [Paludisphaera soli]|uniref:hypothetical protein n=1 Tax=Paludisphaera soli TaxID=2712865 RepID=UPI001F0E2F14|nr:hypothetical protein [Paludisphaera soli]